MKKISNFVNKIKSWAKKDPTRTKRILFIIIVIGAIICAISINSNLKTKLRVKTIWQKVTEIKQISELCTVTYYDEEVVKDTVDESSSKITVVIAKGTVRAGFDLSKMTAISTSYDSIALFLPSAQILDVIVNPSGFETITEEGTWTHDEYIATRMKAREKILVHSVEDDILNVAEENGRNQLTAMFKALGFKTISITIVSDTTDVVEDVLNLQI